MDAAQGAAIVASVSAIVLGVINLLRDDPVRARENMPPDERIPLLESRVDDLDYKLTKSERAHQNCERKLARLEGEYHALRATLHR